MVAFGGLQNGLMLAALSAALVLSGCKPEAVDLPSGRAGPSAPASQPPASAATPPEPVPSTGLSGEATAGDSKLASRIETALSAEIALHGASIGVSAADGVVTLTGSTRTEELRSMAAQIALSVDGVKLVRNELAVARET